MNQVMSHVKKMIGPLIIIIVIVVSGILLGASVALAAKSLKNPPIQIIRLNEESLFREQSLKCAELNLDEKSLQKKLSDFKEAFMNLLKGFPPNYVFVRSNLLLRSDNLADFTELFKTLLFTEAKGLQK
jgi:flagellar basal body-associated protein FliL